jgi:hypothetical protein
MRLDLLRAEIILWMRHFLGQDVLQYIKTGVPDHFK